MSTFIAYAFQLGLIWLLWAMWARLSEERSRHNRGGSHDGRPPDSYDGYDDGGGDGGG